MFLSFTNSKITKKGGCNQCSCSMELRHFVHERKTNVIFGPTIIVFCVLCENIQDVL